MLSRHWFEALLYKLSSPNGDFAMITGERVAQVGSVANVIKSLSIDICRPLVELSLHTVHNNNTRQSSYSSVLLAKTS